MVADFSGAIPEGKGQVNYLLPISFMNNIDIHGESIIADGLLSQEENYSVTRLKKSALSRYYKGQLKVVA